MESSFVAVLLVLMALSSSVSSRHITRPHLERKQANEGDHEPERELYVEKMAAIGPQIMGPDTFQVAGSSLPDCSHACGSCRPCRLVMVSFVCASLAEAETCPMAYKCMCRNKSYPVP
ncbi:Protein EPIDERMAL PATTERNING FACTOR 1 [Dionaea muscipula]